MLDIRLFFFSHLNYGNSLWGLTNEIRVAFHKLARRIQWGCWHGTQGQGLAHGLVMALGHGQYIFDERGDYAIASSFV